MFSFLGKKKEKAASGYDGEPLDPQWARNARGKFHRLIHLDTQAEDLRNKSGVYVIWHSGVKPAWVYVGKSTNLAADIDAAAENEDILDYEVNGGLYVTWSPVLPEKQNGVIRFLHESMSPEVENAAAKSIKDCAIRVRVPRARGLD